MHDFKLKNNTLYCEQVPLERIAAAVGTPVFVYSRKTLLDHLRKLQRAFAPVDALICYSMKANSNLSICRLLTQAGAGVDIVSGGELYRAKKAGVPGEKIVYASVGKTMEEIEEALAAGIAFFNVESKPELELIDAVAGRLKKCPAAAIRVNPDVDAHTHHYITTAKKQNKFGIDFDAAEEIFLRTAPRLRHVRLCGIHVHIGSQIEHVTPFVEALKKTAAFIARLNGRGAAITHLNIGGGLGIIYHREKPQTADAYARVILPILRKTGLRIIMEPGRFIAGNAGVLLTKVLYVKDTAAKRFVIVDAAMNDLIRPSFYGAYHDLVVMPAARGGRRRAADVVGPVCESGDFLAKDRLLPAGVRQGNVIAVLSAGAYGFSMSSNYNSRRRAAEVLVSGDRYRVIRKRETYQDLVRNDVIGES
ncbi:MAG: diaminopimelate decarboxylase [Candidatus Omnitrophica bacterium]|nr:diaminopimelate decarboxylase [Candidatus Omnitrophota bacterium]